MEKNVKIFYGNKVVKYWEKKSKFYEEKNVKLLEKCKNIVCKIIRYKSKYFLGINLF